MNRTRTLAALATLLLAAGLIAACGGDDKEDAACYETSFPDVYEEARAVARIVSDPPSSTFRAEPKKRLGRCIALASNPPERILPDCGHSEFQARANRVMESRKMTTSMPYSTIRLARSP